MGMNEAPALSIDQAIEQLQRIRDIRGGHREFRLVIRKHNPGGLTAHQTTDVVGLATGFDWEAGQVVLTPARPLTELSPEQVNDIQKSVRAGGSWHAYESQKKLCAEIERLKALLKTYGLDASSRETQG